MLFWCQKMVTNRHAHKFLNARVKTKFSTTLDNLRISKRKLRRYTRRTVQRPSAVPEYVIESVRWRKVHVLVLHTNCLVVTGHVVEEVLLLTEVVHDVLNRQTIGWNSGVLPADLQEILLGLRGLRWL